MAKFRLWDTENKKIVWAVDKSDHKKVYQVWTDKDGSKLYIYKKNGWTELDQTKEDVKEYGPVWKELNDETVGYYLTNEPTDLYSWDSGDEASYRFMNGTTVLQSGEVEEGETPEYTGETPTKTDVKPYITYEFDGWKPEVGPIYKKTDFKAQFTKTEVALENYALSNGGTLLTFGDGATNDYVSIGRETDPETGEDITAVGVDGLFDDDFFVGTYGEENQNGWKYIFLEAFADANDLLHLIDEGEDATNGEWKSEVWSALQTYYATPTKANADAVIAAIEATRDSETGLLEPITWTILPLPTLVNAIDANSENSADLLTIDSENLIMISIEVDAGTGEEAVMVNPVGVFANERYVQGGFNAWSELFVSAMDIERVKSMIENATEFPEDIFAAMNTFYNNPTLENIQSLASLLQQWNPGGEEPEQ